MILLKKKDFIYLLLERGEGKEKEREKNINVWLLLSPPYWGPGPGLCPDWESNWQHWFRVHAQSTELHQPGLKP